VEKHEEKLTPLFAAQGVVGSKVASQWADSLARTGADSILRVARTPRDFQRYVRERSYETYTIAWTPGGAVDPGLLASPEAREDVRAMRRPGMLPRVESQHPDYFVVHVDSIVPADSATWEGTRVQALADFLLRRRVAQAVHALDAARAELAAGVPWDSVAAPWGGGLSFAHRRGMPAPGFESPGPLDSVIFGDGARRLADGQTAILAGRHSAALVQLVGRNTPQTALTTEQREMLRQAVMERRFYDYFETLKRRYPVRILRADLRTNLPPPPAL
jgi:hypothetical protein